MPLTQDNIERIVFARQVLGARGTHHCEQRDEQRRYARQEGGPDLANGGHQVVEVAWLREVARVSDARDRMTLILTEEGAIVVEMAVAINQLHDLPRAAREWRPGQCRKLPRQGSSLNLIAAREQITDDRGQDNLHRHPHLATGHDDGITPRRNPG